MRSKLLAGAVAGALAPTAPAASAATVYTCHTWGWTNVVTTTSRIGAEFLMITGRYTCSPLP